MTRKQTLISLRLLVYNLIHEFVHSLSPEEKEEQGSLKYWSVKDNLYHIGLWDKRLVDNIRAAVNGTPQVDYSEYLKINDQDYTEYQKNSWQDVEEILQSSQHDLLLALQSIPDEQLESVEFLEGSEGRPAWWVLSGFMLGHPVIHLTEYLVQHGLAQQALKIMMDFTEAERALDNSERWQGLMSYNQACYLALAGLKEEAQAKLAEALARHPGLEEWSKQDPDLASLRV